jgi:hypothetical protein
MPLPASDVVGDMSLKAWESDFFRIYSDWVFASVTVSVDGDAWTTAPSVVDLNGVQCWAFPVAGPLAVGPLAGARVLTATDHVVRWVGTTAAGQSRGGDATIYIQDH